MPTLNITDQEFLAYSQGIQNKHIRFELLNYSFQTVDELSGIGISGTISIDANADVRRTGNIVLVVTDSTFEVEPGGRIWLDKYLRVYVGVDSVRTGETIWTNCGVFIIDAPSYQYDAATNTLSLSLLDLMAKLTGVRDGYLPGVPVLLKAGENIREAIIDTLALGGFTKYIVEEAPSPGTIPNDLEFDQGATVYDVLAGLRDIYPDHEIYFDVNGVFYYKAKPTGQDDPVLIDDSLWENVVISETIDVDFQNVKNSIEVYGRTHDPAHFSTATTVSGTAISLTIEDVTEYTEDMIYGFTLTDNTGITAPTLKINDLASYPIRMDDGTTPAEIVAEEGEIYFCVQFQGTYWRWLGHLQSYAKVEDDNPDSPFYVEGTVGRLHLPLFGGDYENCFTDDLALQRAEFELWLHTNLNNSITLTCVVVPWIDVNILVQYTSKRNGQTAQYLIQMVNFGLAPTDNMTVTMIRFYPRPTT